ncbi:hypothetical protein AB0H16_27585, partial [Streptomyces lydicus]|uniref:hypothetical protein n=1 Tax=Streptomyces lydicus TaxID=47763 RepID=UPI0033F44778
MNEAVTEDGRDADAVRRMRRGAGGSGKEPAELLAQARALLPDLRKEAVEAVRIGAQRSRV